MLDSPSAARTDRPCRRHRFAPRKAAERADTTVEGTVVDTETTSSPAPADDGAGIETTYSPTVTDQGSTYTSENLDAGAHSKARSTP